MNRRILSYCGILIKTVLSVSLISVCSWHTPRGRQLLLSLQASCQPALLMPTPPPAHWLTAGWTSPWLMWQTIGLMFLLPFNPDSFTQQSSGKTMSIHQRSPPQEIGFKPFRVYPAGQLPSLTDWSIWSRDEKWLFCPRRHFFDEIKHFMVHACWCTWTLTK